jgi:large subunit ribosomal protein L2
MKLKNIPRNYYYNIELESGEAEYWSDRPVPVLFSRTTKEDTPNIKMPSSEIRKISGECYASVGSVSNSEYRFINWSKAGKSRMKGIRPHVRGSVMNPCDHPHGGGECRTGIGLKHPKTPWGKPALGVKTRKKNRWTSKLIIQRRVKKKRKKHYGKKSKKRTIYRPERNQED